LIDFGRGELVPYEELVGEMIELVRPAAEELGCVDEVEHASQIVRRGTSADRQLEVYHLALAQGASEEKALHSVVDWLIAETVNV
jgi:carboxylate-amine ligase